MALGPWIPPPHPWDGNADPRLLATAGGIIVGKVISLVSGEYIITEPVWPNASALPYINEVIDTGNYGSLSPMRTRVALSSGHASYWFYNPGNATVLIICTGYLDFQ